MHLQQKQSDLNSDLKPDLISINNLSISFGNNSVLHKLNLSIGTGQTLALVGESGSGKSLTALSLLQLLPPHAKLSGELLLGLSPQKANEAMKSVPQADTRENAAATAVDLMQLNKAQMQQIRGAQIAMIFQEPMSSLNPVISCGRQVAEAIMTHRAISEKDARAQVIRLFTEVQLPEPEKLFNKYPHQISGGQKQRVMIAMAMSLAPRLLICDEPTTALDVIVQKEILQLIKQLQQKTNMSVLFISHDIQLVAEIADQIAVLYRGDLVEFGPASRIITQPAHPYTQALLSCRPGLYEKGERLPVVADFLKQLRPEPEPDTRTAVATAAAKTVTSDKRTSLLASVDNKNKNNKPDEGAPAPMITKATTPSPTATPILQLQNLNVWYETKRDFLGRTTHYFKAVKDFSLDIYKGETLGLVGGSGCGKTTLGRAIIGLTAIHDGSIVFKDQRWQKEKGQTRRLATQMQMIFQDPYSALNPRIKIGIAIGEALMVHGQWTKKEIKSKVQYWLERVGLQTSHYDRYPHEFSGGQRQRLVIARALILEPDFVICDESVSALDVSVQAQILNLLNDLKADLGFTSIFISHDLSVVRYISDRIAVMNQGHLEELGPAQEVYNHPKSDYTKALLAATFSSGLKTSL